MNIGTLIPAERIAKGLWWSRTWTLVDGCTHVSAGCDHCWAASEANMRQHNPNAKIAERYAGLTRGQKPEARGQRPAFSRDPQGSAVLEVANGQRPEGSPERPAPAFNGTIRCRADNLTLPLHTRKPQVWAVWNDLFHPSVANEFIRDAFDAMWLRPGSAFMVLTKRARMVRWVAEHASALQFHWGCDPINGHPFVPGTCATITDIRMRDQCGWVGDDEKHDWFCLCPDNEERGGDNSCDERTCPLANNVDDRATLQRIGVADEYQYDRDGFADDSEWMEFHARPRSAFVQNALLGVTAEAQAQFDKRIRWLHSLRQHVPHATLWLSLEPMLGPIDLSAAFEQIRFCPNAGSDAPESKAVVDWVVIGGESGPHARACNVDWIRSAVGQCQAAHVPVFVKQLGSLSLDTDGSRRRHDSSDRKCNLKSFWPADLRVRQFPEVTL